MKLFLCLALLVAVALAAPSQRTVKRYDSAAAASAAANADSTTVIQIQNGPPGGYNGGGYNGGDVDAQRDALIQTGARQVISDAARPFQSAFSIAKGFLPG